MSNTKNTKKVERFYEAIISDAILTFCENLAELGCPRYAPDSDMWFRELSKKDRQKVIRKLIKIMDRNNEITKNR